MPKRHGLLQEKERLPVMLFGIHEIFWQLVDPAFSKNPQIDEETRDIRKRYFEESYYHFEHIMDRFFDALDIFQQNMAALDKIFSMDMAERPLFLHMNTQRRAGMAADAVLQYLGILLDVIGSLIPFVVLDKPKDYSCYSHYQNKRCDSLHKVKKNAEQNSQFAQLKDIFAKLDMPNSWWAIGYKRGEGMRQRITHFSDFVMFHGSGKTGENTMKTKATLGNAVDLNNRINFDEALKSMLAGLCDWLDELEQNLFEILQNRATGLGKMLTRKRIFLVILPIFREEAREIPDKDFLYLPMCDGS